MTATQRGDITGDVEDKEEEEEESSTVKPRETQMTHVL